MISYILIASWFVFVIASAFAHQYWKRRVNTAAALDIKKEFNAQNENAKRILQSLGNMGKKLEFSEQNARLSVPKGATRVYAVLLQRGVETRILVQPADTIEEMQRICMREIGNGWVTVITAHTDVLAPSPIEVKEPETKRAAVVEKPIATFIHDLEYSRDKFAETPTEKAAMESIISKLRKSYGTSNSTSAA